MHSFLDRKSVLVFLDVGALHMPRRRKETGGRSITGRKGKILAVLYLGKTGAKEAAK